MEVPEKIYLTKNLLGELHDGWDALPSNVFANFEYVCTDAFIDKACKYISQHQCEYIDFEDFKHYMKGE